MSFAMEAIRPVHWILLGSLPIAAAIIYVVVAAARCPAGWRLWMLYQVNRIYVRLVFRWKSNRPCPLSRRGPGDHSGEPPQPGRSIAAVDEPRSRGAARTLPSH